MKKPEIIESISEVQNIKENEKDWSGFNGYQIKTNKQDILFLIENGQSCCENWGYITSIDKVDDFVGATLLEIKTTDAGLSTKELKENYITENECMFLTLETSKGTLQFTVYNSHNGYYSHQVKIISKTINEERYL